MSDGSLDNNHGDTESVSGLSGRDYLAPPAEVKTESGISPSLNNWTVIGVLSSDIELNSTQSGSMVARFNISIERHYLTRTGETREEVELVNAVVFGELASESSQLLKPGERLYAEGRLAQRTWDDSSGSRQYITELIVDNIWSLDAPETNAETPVPVIDDPKGFEVPSLNSITLIGNLGQDPELTYTANGVARTNLSLATNRRVRRDGDFVDETSWHRITLWRDIAERTAQYLEKGRRVLVEGSVSSYRYTSDDGSDRVFTSITGQRVQYFPKQEAAQSRGNSGSMTESLGGASGALDPDDLPF